MIIFRSHVSEGCKTNPSPLRFPPLKPCEARSFPSNLPPVVVHVKHSVITQVLLRSRDATLCWTQDHMLAYLGHCPQEDPLWPDLTVHEHLKVYAAVKGVHKEDIATAINRCGVRVVLGSVKGLFHIVSCSEEIRMSEPSVSKKMPWNKLRKQICKRDFVLNAVIE